jgi:hypothetical protein
MAPILAPLLGFLFLRGHIILKNWSYCPLLRASTSPFKSTCLLIRLKEEKIDLYRITDSGISPYLPPYGRACFFNARQRCRIEPGSCIMARSVPRLKIFLFNYTHNQRIPLSTEAHVVLDQINPALNREGVKLQFNQSYRFELTTNPLGKHYINS